jgi:AsmA family protein
MRIRTILIGLAMSLVVLVGGALVYLLTLDVNDYRDEIASAAEKATGRQLVLGGPLDLEVSLTPALVAQDVSLANAPWGSRPEMVRLKRLEVQVELLPLVFGEVRVQRLVLAGADILLETNAEGRGNWVFDTAAAEPAPEEEPAPDSKQQLLAEQILIEDGVLTFRNGQTGADTVVAADRISMTAETYDSPIAFEVDTSVNDVELAAEGEVGPLTTLMNGGAPYPVAIDADALGIELHVDGTIDAPMDAQGINLTLEVKAEDLGDLQKLTGAAIPAGLPLAVTGQIGGGAEAIDIRDLKIALGESSLAGNIGVRLTGPRPRIEAALAGDRLDLTELVPAGEAGETETEGATPVTAEAGKVFPDDPLPLDGLKLADAHLDLKVQELLLPSLTASDLAVVLGLENGALTVEPLRATIAGSPVEATVGLNASSATPQMKFTASAPQLDLGRLLTEAEVTDLLEGQADIAVDVNGQGASVAAIMGSLNGQTKLLMNSGRAKTAAFDKIVGGLSTVMGTLFSGKSEWTVLNCVASNFAIDDGIATSKVMLVDTEYSTVVGEGTVDLGTEQLDLTVTPAAKSEALNVAVPVKIGGTLAEPIFRPDELATARQITGLLGADLFPPTAVTGLGEMGSGEDNPCVNIASGGAAAPTTSETPAPIESIPEDAKGAVEELGKGLKGLLGD